MSNNDLIVIEKMDVVPFFTKGERVDDVLTQIEAEVLAFVPDVTTTKGRAAIKAMVTKVTKSKTYLESKGKDLAAEYKAIPKAIDANRRIVKDKLTSLAEQVRQPLTEYEEEATRLAVEKMEAEKAAKLAQEIEVAHELGMLLNEKFDSERAAAIEAERLDVLKRAFQVKAAQEAREKQIAEDAAASAEAEKKAALVRAKLAEEAAEARSKQAEIDRVAAEEKAIQDAKDAAENARLAEIARQQAVADKEAAELVKREANKKHIGAIRKAAKESIMALGVDEDTAKKIVMAISNKEIANVQINY